MTDISTARPRAQTMTQSICVPQTGRAIVPTSSRTRCSCRGDIGGRSEPVAVQASSTGMRLRASSEEGDRSSGRGQRSAVIRNGWGPLPKSCGCSVRSRRPDGLTAVTLALGPDRWPHGDLRRCRTTEKRSDELMQVPRSKVLSALCAGPLWTWARDDLTFVRALPLARATDPGAEILIAYEMNGESPRSRPRSALPDRRTALVRRRVREVAEAHRRPDRVVRRRVPDRSLHVRVA
jgi:hypothetical protein